MTDVMRVSRACNLFLITSVFFINFFLSYLSLHVFIPFKGIISPNGRFFMLLFSTENNFFLIIIIKIGLIIIQFVILM